MKATGIAPCGRRTPGTWRESRSVRSYRRRLGAPAQHEPAISEIRFFHRSLGDVDACGNVRAAVVTVLQVHRQPGEVGILSGPYRLMHGRHRTWHFNRRNRCRAFKNLLEQARRVDAESERQPAAAPRTLPTTGRSDFPPGRAFKREPPWDSRRGENRYRRGRSARRRSPVRLHRVAGRESAGAGMPQVYRVIPDGHAVIGAVFTPSSQSSVT